MTHFPSTGVPTDRTRTADEIRRTFLDFFEKRDHEVCRSAPLIPANDPTLMFTNAGMVPFKDVFTGRASRERKRAASSQKCIRISGKHNDLENVGVTARHHTFFEMLGNFSFGDYFKEEAIVYAWELLTKVLELPTDRMIVTYFGGEDGIAPDEEARDLWLKVSGLDERRVLPMGAADNFWQMGDTGPCGPCSEVHFFLGDPHGTGIDVSSFGTEPESDGRGWMEIWNLVFMQFDRQVSAGGEATLAPLPAPCVDTGAGLERLASVLQGKTSNYETDLLRVLVDKASDIAGKGYGGSLADDDVSMRVIADHARTTAFLLAEGIFPDRAGREYVLRRVMRRAIRHGHRLGIREPFLHEVALEVVRTMGDTYPELRERRDLIASVSEQEEVRFRQTVDRGLKLLDEELSLVKGRGADTLSGYVAFKLYDTFGFPIDLTEVIARERRFEVDMDGFERELAAQRARSEGSRVGDARIEAVYGEALERVTKASSDGVRFLGYDDESSTATVVAVISGGALVEEATGEVEVVCDRTPFYAESGGQVGDVGTIRLPSGASAGVVDTQRPLPGLTVHSAHLGSEKVRVGDTLRLEVDHDKRTRTRRNHSATHLLHWALRQVLGEQATQKGSLVGPDRLRFDFSHGRPLSDEEIARIEDLVNAKILTNAPVETAVLPIEEARAKGAVAIFEEKYGDVVRVLTMTPDSVELCGGTHARALGEIGCFKILSEGGVAAGVRRIEAATGERALAHVREVETTLREVAQLTKCSPQDVAERVTRLVEQVRGLERELGEAKRKLAMGGSSGGLDAMLDGARTIEGGKALATEVDVSDPKTLRELAEQLRDKLGDAAVLVGAKNGPKVALVLTVSGSLTSRLKAGELIKPIAEQVGGKGGGRPDMAQAGGTRVEGLSDAMEAFYRAVGSEAP